MLFWNSMYIWMSYMQIISKFSLREGRSCRSSVNFRRVSILSGIRRVSILYKSRRRGKMLISAAKTSRLRQKISGSERFHYFSNKLLSPGMLEIWKKIEQEKSVKLQTSSLSLSLSLAKFQSPQSQISSAYAYTYICIHAGSIIRGK